MKLAGPQPQQIGGFGPDVIVLRQQPLLACVRDAAHVRAVVLQKKAGVQRLHCSLCVSRSQCEHTRMVRGQVQIVQDESAMQQTESDSSDSDISDAEDMDIDRSQLVPVLKPLPRVTPLAKFSPSIKCSCEAHVDGPHLSSCSSVCSQCSTSWTEAKETQVIRD
jgi:hypothetical protein